MVNINAFGRLAAPSVAKRNASNSAAPRTGNSFSVPLCEQPQSVASVI